LLVKPAGPDCNLACEYCFYTPKQELYPRDKRHRMSRQVAEEMIRQYMTMSPEGATFAWQGGEPTLMGLDFFRLVVALQMKHGGPGQVVSNALQTNGTLIDEEWARFLRRYRFLVGISIDGPPEVHDKWRVDHGGGPTLDQVLKGVKALQDEGVEYNALVMLTSHSADKAGLVWEFLREQGIDFFQFIPCLERDRQSGEMSEYSVTPEQYGEFMCEVFDLWSRSASPGPAASGERRPHPSHSPLPEGEGTTATADSGCPSTSLRTCGKPEPRDGGGWPETYVRLFNDLVEIYAGGEGPSCMLKERCGEYVVIEHNGDVYACDFFVDPEHYVGNLVKTSLAELVKSEKLEEFAVAKGSAGPECESCRWWKQCFGGCPKDRIYGSGRTDCASYLCAGYKMVFEHADARLRELGEYYKQERGQCEV